MSYDIHINTFHMRGTTAKAQAVKVLEESAEVFGAWQNIQKPIKYINGERCFPTVYMLANEIADCMQALANLADMYDIDLEAAMRTCDERNEARGRL